MKLSPMSLASLAIVLLATPIATAAVLADGVSFAVEEGTELTRTFEARGEYELKSAALILDGERVRESEDVEMTIDSLERIVVTDELDEIEDGRPTDLTRTFVELVQESTDATEDEEYESSSSSDLEGLSVRFLWDEDDESYYAEAVDDDDDLEDDVLAWLAGDMDFLEYLPDGEVSEGDEWDLDASAYLAIMWPGGLLGFYDDGDVEIDPFNVAVDRQVVENLTGSGTATLEELRDEDGESVAVISIELDVETWALEDREVEGGEVTYDIEINREIEGELVWNLDRGRLDTATFDAVAGMVRTVSWTAETEDGDIDVEQEERYEGTIAYEVEFEEE